MWNNSLREGTLPVSWKTGHITPLPKVPIPSDVRKHIRPITLTPQLSKCLEWFPKKYIMDTITDLIGEQQYGCLPGKSTSMALADLLHNWITSLETPGKAIRILMVDYRKAFDRVDHNLVTEKLESMGVAPFLVSWTRSFLHERQNQVKIETTYSSPCTMRAGVPQGTLLGPVLFMCHINDLKPSPNIVKYVDDTTIWEACSFNGEDSTIQQSANVLMEWSTNNKMQLNTDKTKEMVVYFGKKALALNQIRIQDSNIEQVSSFKLLGVTINDQLTWQDHVQNICKKAAQRLYFLILLKRAGITPKDIIKVYISIVRSILEYAAVIWHPGLTKQQTLTVEHIQERALRIAYPEKTYEDALSEAGIENLETRRENMCAKFFQDIQQISHPMYKYLPPERTQRNLRYQRKYETPRLKTNRLKKSPVFYGLFRFQ